jgi:hypothetical protein
MSESKEKLRGHYIAPLSKKASTQSSFEKVGKY